MVQLYAMGVGYMFLGTYEIILGSKRSFTIPKRLKGVDKTLILTSIDPELIILRNKEGWDAKDIIKGANVEDTSKLLEYIYSHSYEVEVDDKGKVRIPNKVQFDSTTGEKVFILGNNKSIEILSAKRYERFYEESMKLLKSSGFLSELIY